MYKVTIFLIVVISILDVSVASPKQSIPAVPKGQSTEQSSIDQSALQLAIASVDPMLKVTDHYRVGEQTIIAISMVNTSNQAGYVCASSDLYQDVPALKRNGRLLPYAKWQNYLLGNVRMDQTCRDVDLPENILLKPNEPAIVDFLTIVDDTRNPTGALSWYDQLTPGSYELTVQRRLGCCGGPLIESNKLSFEVVP